MRRALASYIVVVGAVLGVFFTTIVPMVDAARNSSGVHSLPAGNPVVTGTSITSSWANNTMNDISSELTSSLDRAGRGAMTAPLQLATGSCAAPSLTFSAESDVGLYRAGSNDARVCVASFPNIKFTATGTVFPEIFTSEKGYTATQSTSNGAAITGTGNGTGAGVSGVASATTNSVGVLGTSTTDSGSAGVKGVATTRYGVKGEATSGRAVFGDATSGSGGYFTATSGRAAQGISSSDTGVHGEGAAYGVYGEGTGGGFGVGVGNGHLKANGANPANTTGFTNTLTPMNVPKAWGKVACSGSCSMSNGFNIKNSISISPSSCATFEFATPMANANYAVLALGAVDKLLTGGPVNASTFSLCITDASAFASNGSSSFVVFGEQ